MGILQFDESMIKNNSKFKLRIFIVSLYTLLVFLLETFFRQPLFDLSERVEIDFQKNIDPSFFKLISKIGTQPVYLPVTVICFIFLPLNFPFTLLSVIIHATYWDNLLKMLYGEARPYWVFRDLSPSCNCGFGNPSGHSMSSSAVYLSIWHIVTNNKYFEERYFIKMMLLSIFIFLILLIIFSRLVLAAHSINQVLFGGLLGVSIYLFHFYVFKMDKLKSKDFFEFFTSKKKIRIFAVFYLLLLLISFFVYFFVGNKTVIEENIDYISKNCGEIQEYRKFNEDGIFHCLSIFALMGSHIGIGLFTNFIERKRLFIRYEEIYNFNKTGIKKKIFILLILLISGSPILLFFIIPGDSTLILILIFKVTIPYILGCIGIFGVSLMFCIKYKICNEDIYDQSNNQYLNPRLSI